VQGEPAWLSPHTCEQLYGIVREALNNIVKHAKARHVQLELDWQPDNLMVRLVDDGVGFDPRLPPEEGHYGLTLMRETVEALRGELLIESAPGHGSRLTVRIPLSLSERTPRSLAA
jgi:signal transduction histidine kinase